MYSTWQKVMRMLEGHQVQSSLQKCPKTGMTKLNIRKRAVNELGKDIEEDKHTNMLTSISIFVKSFPDMA